MAPKKAVRKRTLSSTTTPKGKDTEPAKRLRTRTPVKPMKEDSTEDDNDDSGSDFEENESNAEESEEEESPSDISEEDYGKKSGSAKKKGARTSTGSAKKTNLPTRTAAGAAENGGGTGYGPGVQIITKKAKARSAGNVRYTEETLHPNTMLFLGDLKANNKREWLKGNDPDYRASLADFNSFIEKLSERLIEIDDTIPELPVKDLVFRIHRDVRFSKDPTPYKTHFSAAWSRTGRKGMFAKYYLQVAPGDCLIAAGLWQPDNIQVAAMRRDIDRRPNRIKQALRQPGMRKDYLDGVADDEKKVLAKFLDHNKSNALKVRPKDYEADHPNIDLLRLRNYTVACRFSDDLVVGEGGLERVAEKIRSLVPFITYLNSVVMPDDEEEDENDEEEEEDED